MRYFGFTLAVEAPVYILLSRKEVSARRALLAAIACSAVTHPLLWFAWKPLIHSLGGGYTTYILSGELLVSIIESFIFFAIARPIPFSKAVAASFIANASSFGLGALCNHFHILH
jgi:hypothetical protein